MNNLYDIIKESVDSVDDIGKEIDEIVDGIVNSSCSDLDEYIDYVRSLLNDDTSPITDGELNHIIITLPTYMYYSSSHLESLGIREDLAKIHENNAYMEALQLVTGSVQEKQVKAKSQIQTEAITTIVYQRANKKIKAKNDTALELLQSCKKILNCRIAELELSKNSSNHQTN